jgi:hypothetical protein
MLAPPNGEDPISQRPRVARTTASAIGRPRPVPPGRSLARWKRSNTRARWSSVMPGPASPTASRTCPAATSTRTAIGPQHLEPGGRDGLEPRDGHARGLMRSPPRTARTSP